MCGYSATAIFKDTDELGHWGTLLTWLERHGLVSRLAVDEGAARFYQDAAVLKLDFCRQP